MSQPNIVNIDLKVTDMVKVQLTNAGHDRYNTYLDDVAKKAGIPIATESGKSSHDISAWYTLPLEDVMYIFGGEKHMFVGNIIHVSSK